MDGGTGCKEVLVVGGNSGVIPSNDTAWLGVVAVSLSLLLLTSSSGVAGFATAEGGNNAFNFSKADSCTDNVLLLPLLEWLPQPRLSGNNN